MINTNWTRRQIIQTAGALGLVPSLAFTQGEKMLTRAIPSSNEQMPVIGLGTYSVFDVPSTPDEIASRRNIVQMLTDAGGNVIDTSPMYNRSEQVIGDIIASGAERDSLFIATKVWTNGRDSGVQQMQKSAELMNTDVIDLMQVHNLRDTAVHMATIKAWQQEGRIRYNGLTHYTASAHDTLEAEMKRYEPQFIQINYSLAEREAEDRILPLAADMGIAVLINRPYQSGALFRAVGDRSLPDWAREFATSWGQFFLKFIVSHPAVTCVIPATSKARHMQDNLLAGFGPMPDRATRTQMTEFLAEL